MAFLKPWELPAQNQEFYSKWQGPWLNRDYSSIRFKVSKFIGGEGETFIGFDRDEDTREMLSGHFTLEEMWEDEEGNWWYRAVLHDIVFQRVIHLKRAYYELGRFDPDGTTWEFVYDKKEYPESIDKQDRNYRVYYRYTP
jgi:YD repeat-containing protein